MKDPDVLYNMLKNLLAQIKVRVSLGVLTHQKKLWKNFFCCLIKFSEVRVPLF